MSSTVVKALSLLDLFTEDTPERGLSELARSSGIDKATVHRMMMSLAEAGLIEQREDTRLYRLGAGILRLARIREAAFPVASIIEPVLARLTQATGETAHVSLLSGGKLATVGISDSPKANRVSLVAGENLSLHGTASGIVTLAYSSRQFVDRVLRGNLRRHTSHTPSDPQAVREWIKMAEKNGYALADQTFEDEVYGIAAPLFGASAVACGAIAVATPTHRMNPEFRQHVITQVSAAAMEVTERIGGQLPAEYRAVAHAYLSNAA